MKRHGLGERRNEAERARDERGYDDTLHFDVLCTVSSDGMNAPVCGQYMVKIVLIGKEPGPLR
jgi:hypothetical protein